MFFAAQVRERRLQHGFGREFPARKAGQARAQRKLFTHRKALGCRPQSFKEAGREIVREGTCATCRVTATFGQAIAAAEAVPVETVPPEKALYFGADETPATSLQPAPDSCSAGPAIKRKLLRSTI